MKEKEKVVKVHYTLRLYESTADGLRYIFDEECELRRLNMSKEAEAVRFLVDDYFRRKKDRQGTLGIGQN